MHAHMYGYLPYSSVITMHVSTAYIITTKCKRPHREKCQLVLRSKDTPKILNVIALSFSVRLANTLRIPIHQTSSVCDVNPRRHCGRHHDHCHHPLY